MLANLKANYVTNVRSIDLDEMPLMGVANCTLALRVQFLLPQHVQTYRHMFIVDGKKF